MQAYLEVVILKLSQSIHLHLKQYYTIFLKIKICPNAIVNAIWDINKQYKLKIHDQFWPFLEKKMPTSGVQIAV